MAKKTIKQVKEDLLAEDPGSRDPVPTEDLLKTGSTILDLACSGRRQGGFAKGKYFWMVGDSSSGKTFLMLTCLAEASINKAFDDYRFIYDNAEDGALMNLHRYFGPGMASRLEPPALEEPGGAPRYSGTIEDFYFNLDDAFAANVPFIYLLDSMDSLDSDYAGKKFAEKKRAARGGKPAKGDYGDGKAKITSGAIRRVVQRLRDTGSILIILSQTRDNIDGGMFDPQQTSAGGRALRFYATVQLWSSVGSKIKKTVADQEVQVGVHCRVAIKKNRINGVERTIEFPIFYSTGIDDIGGMIDWLVKWKFWKKKSALIDASVDFDNIKKRREDLVQWITTNDLRADLEEIVEDAWVNVEARLAVDRENKYDAKE